MNVFEQVIKFINGEKTTYQILEHEPTHTSLESARARGDDLKIGAKALIVKADNSFYMIVLSAAKRIDSNSLKKVLKCKSLRFATDVELNELTHCQKGAVPPFGQLFGLPVVLDESLSHNESVAFNAGSLTRSVRMNKHDFFMIHRDARKCDISS
jgi:Ala-tRNA(Pro) deacylase